MVAAGPRDERPGASGAGEGSQHMAFHNHISTRGPISRGRAAGLRATRYYASAHRVAVASPTSPQGLVMVYPAPTGGGSIGKAYYCGQDAAGDPAWSLKIHGRWLE